MDALILEKTPGEQSDILFVLLPGRRDEPNDFVRNGFVDALWDKGIEADIVIPDAHLGYYYERILDERLMQDIIRPIQAKQYKEIWAVGVSLGGFGAIMFERDHPGTWDGVILIAPFTGDHQDVLEDVRLADDLQSIQFPENPTDDDYTAKFWNWIQSHGSDPQFPIYLGLGTGDRMYDDQTPLLDSLDPDGVIQIPGAHNWDVWRQLWQQLLDVWIESEYKTD